MKLNDLFVVATKDDEIVGFCMGYEHGYNAQKNFIHNNRIRLASWLLFLCLRGNKLAITKCLGRIKRNKKSSEWIRNESVKD
ncbi:MAG: hypothetical protein K2J33_02675, partial [Alistipes sp.]|nr:hypothetical protein [Alistipes sp.]